MPSFWCHQQAGLGISLHQEVFLRLIWEITKEIAESYTSKDTLDSLPLIVLDICIALGYY